jgi:hypothetical protein
MNTRGKTEDVKRTSIARRLATVQMAFVLAGAIPASAATFNVTPHG